MNGTKASGQEVRNSNVTACITLSNIVKTSLGPVGLDKMLVDDVGDVTITNDGATILKLLEVEHPAAKVLVELADLQDQEVGDGTTSVVILAAELLKRANELVKQGIHPTSIINGFRLASRESVKHINNNLRIPIANLGSGLLNAAKTSMSSKVINIDSEFFGQLAVKAMLRSETINSRGDKKYPLKAVSILKSQGKSSKETQLIEGYALNCTVASAQMPKLIENAKVVVLDMNLHRERMGLNVQVNLDDPTQVEKVKEREATMVRDRIQLILKSGANVIVTTKAIDDLAQKYLVEAGVMGIRRASKDDCRNLCKATGARMISTLADEEGGETFDPSCVGTCGKVQQVPVADQELILFTDPPKKGTASIILRGPNSLMLDELERSLHDSLCIIKRVLESGYVVPGGGAVETDLNVFLENFAYTLASREQLAVAEFAQALLVIPKTLAVNAALDATELIAKLRAHHNAAQTNPEKKSLANYGLDLVNGKVRSSLDSGVLEPSMSKIKSIKFAVEAAITIMRIDTHIKINPPQREQDPHGH